MSYSLKQFVITIIEGTESHIQVNAEGPEDAKEIALLKYRKGQSKIQPMKPMIADIEQVG